MTPSEISDWHEKEAAIIDTLTYRRVMHAQAAATIRELKAERDTWRAMAENNGKAIIRLTDISVSDRAKLKIATEALEPFGKAGCLFDTGKYQQRSAAIYSPADGEEFYLNSGHLLKARDALARIKEVG